MLRSTLLAGFAMFAFGAVSATPAAALAPVLPVQVATESCAPSSNPVVQVGRRIISADCEAVGNATPVRRRFAR